MTKKTNKFEMNVELTLPERINLLGILPQEANFITLRAMKKLEETLSLSEEEVKKYEVNIMPQEGGIISYGWNEEGKSANDEIEIGEIALGVIEKKLKELDSQNKLTNNLFSLYEKFILKEEKNV